MALSSTLQRLVESVEAELARLDEHKTELLEALHGDDNKLPDTRLAQLSARAVDGLHELQQRLEPGHLVLADHFLGYTNTKCLAAAVHLALADILAARGPLSLPDLAQAAGARPDRLAQVLRTLYNNHIFAYDARTGRYANNRVSALLRSDHRAQWHTWVRLYGHEFYDIARGIPAAVEQGADRSAAQINFDTDEDMFTYFQAHGLLPRLHRTLGAAAHAMTPGLLQDYPWHEVARATVVDIGGGGGALVATLLRHCPTMRGAVFDLPGVIAHTAPFFGAGGQFEDVADRVPPENLIAGDFFKSVPASQVYTVKWVLHDWKDDKAVQILRNIREAILPGPVSRLVLLESILSDGRMGRLSRYGDINMMMTANGQERTEVQWRHLAGLAGWKMTRIHHLRNAWFQAMDLEPLAVVDQ